MKIIIIITSLLLIMGIIGGVIFYIKKREQERERRCLASNLVPEIQQHTPLNFKEISKKYLVMEPTEMVNEIATEAYTNIHVIYKNNLNTPLNDKLDRLSNDIRIGLKSTLSIPEDDIKNAIKRVVVLLKDYPQADKFTQLVYNEKDINWAIDQYKQLDFYVNGEYTPNDNQIKNDITNNGNFQGANSSIHYKKYGVAFIRLPLTNNFYDKGPIFIHEYIHTAQPAPWSDCVDNPAKGYQELHPITCWLTEGQSNFIGYSLFSDDKETYISHRRDDNRGEEKLSKKDLKNYIFNDMNPTCIGKPNYNYGYTIGMLIVEFLSAIKGSLSTFDLLIQVRNGKDFYKAFEDIYGIKDDEDKNLLVDIIFIMINSNEKKT